jgi:leucyl aminopeptidase
MKPAKVAGKQSTGNLATGILASGNGASGMVDGKPTTAADVLKPAGAAPLNIWLASDEASSTNWAAKLTAPHRTWLNAHHFSGEAKSRVILPAADGSLSGVAFGLGHGPAEPCGPTDLLVGSLSATLPAGTWAFAHPPANPELAAVAWGLGAYKFRRYKTSGNAPEFASLVIPAGVDLDRVRAIVDGVWLGRDLINTPANDMGPDELEAAARALATLHSGIVATTIGDDLVRDFPLIHAVGRASPRAPRLIDIRWRPANSAKSAPKVTLIGKGICFDTGGLDLKPSAGMLIMKKDMGGAAAALALGHMIMALGLDLDLRILISIAENSVAGNSFRPLDVITSRAGRTIEIGNTDAEGRLVLADALSLADEEAPDTIVSFATLTGAARVALGADLPPLFCDDDAFANALMVAGMAVGDPVWRLPFWAGYERGLDSDIADMNNVSDGPFAGAITAALFLKRFVTKAKRYAHLDIYGWRQAAKPLGPKGGEPHAARAVLEALIRHYSL